MDAPDSELRWISGRTSEDFGSRFTAFGTQNGCQGATRANAARVDRRASRSLRRYE